MSQKAQVIIDRCNFSGVKFDKAAVDAVQRIADGLVINAEALKQLAWVLTASNVKIETLVKVVCSEENLEETDD